MVADGILRRLIVFWYTTGKNHGLTIVVMSIVLIPAITWPHHRHMEHISSCLLLHVHGLGKDANHRKPINMLSVEACCGAQYI